jgi:glycosyltransferase involved in cell wall biosynthesis
MHQYTADLANGCTGDGLHDSAQHADQVTVITTPRAALDRYAAGVRVEPVSTLSGTGLQAGSLKIVTLYRTYRTILAARPDVVHFTGPHLWNPVLLVMLKRARVPTIHTIHDLDPHSGTSYGRLLYAWNSLVLKFSAHIIVHSRLYRDRLINRGVSADRVTYLPLLHLFVNHSAEVRLQQQPTQVHYETFALFFARLEAYKGVDILVEAMRQLGGTDWRAIVAGKGEVQEAVAQPVPGNVEIRNRLISDDEAIDLFSRCGLVVLPYRDATQSALIAAAYFFRKPVVVTRTGALPEYVVDGQTGWVVEPNDAQNLAAMLQHALSDKIRLRRMGECGHEWYQAQRRIERTALQNMYQMVGQGALKSQEREEDHR